ncbi:MAG: hypothetical protein ACTHKF_05650 [Candidatus Nitrosocosmicus sp.]
MRRSIPSIRQILEIENSNGLYLRICYLPKRTNRNFDKVFDRVKLYISYLGNASNPIVTESVMMGAVFHHYKQLLQFNKEDIAIDEDTLKKELESLCEIEPVRKLLFY